MRFGAFISGTLHTLLILYAIVTLPSQFGEVAEQAPIFVELLTIDEVTNVMAKVEEPQPEPETEEPPAEEQEEIEVAVKEPEPELELEPEPEPEPEPEIEEEEAEIVPLEEEEVVEPEIEEPAPEEEPEPEEEQKVAEVPASAKCPPTDGNPNRLRPRKKSFSWMISPLCLTNCPRKTPRRAIRKKCPTKPIALRTCRTEGPVCRRD